MATPLVFTKVTTWVDLTDPANIPPGAKLITAGDLLRYENGIDALVTRVNLHDASLVAMDPILTDAVGDVALLQSTMITEQGNIDTLQAQMTTANNNITALTRSTVVASTAQTLPAAARFYIHTGGAVTSTLPVIAGNTGREIYVKNRGTGTLTLNSETNKMWNTSVVSSVSIVTGAGIGFINDGTYWVRLY